MSTSPVVGGVAVVVFIFDLVVPRLRSAQPGRGAVVHVNRVNVAWRERIITTNGRTNIANYGLIATDVAYDLADFV